MRSIGSHYRRFGKKLRSNGVGAVLPPTAVLSARRSTFGSKGRDLHETAATYGAISGALDVTLSTALANAPSRLIVGAETPCCLPSR